MFKKISIRWRLTILSALLLTICCIGLTIVLNYSAFKMANTIDAIALITPEGDFPPIDIEPNHDSNASILTDSTLIAKNVFRMQSVLYMLLVIGGGSALTYYISGKVLKPLDALNTQIKNISVNNLSESLDIPPTKDEIAELTKSFNDMTDKLNNAFLMQKRFSASAAHELRTPLAVLQTKVDVFLKKDIHSSSEYEALIGVFKKQIRRLRGLTTDLLDMTNMEAINEQSNICLKDLFTDIIVELSSIAKSKNVTLSLTCDDCHIQGNLDLLYRAFYNLLENAIKYNRDDGYVKIEVNYTKGKTIIRIIDNGIGIPDDRKRHIFEPFYRVDKYHSREMGSVGLGLSIVDSIIKKHGGDIIVHDAIDSGTCFEVHL